MTRKKKILYIIWSLDLGGAEQVVVDLAGRLRGGQFEPVVCCLNQKGRHSLRLEEQGIKVIALNKKPKVDFSVIGKLLKIIKEEKIDLIHTHLFSAHLWGRIAAVIARVPVISTEHGIDRWRTKFHILLDRILTRANKKVIFVSKKVRDFYAEQVYPLNGKAEVVYNGIDASQFKRPLDIRAIRLSLGFDPAKKIIGTVGRLVADKAHRDFVKAISLIVHKRKDVLGVIVGEGELRPVLERMIRDLGLKDHVALLGYRSDTSELYRAMDVFVLSSASEGFPLTVLEAIHSGVPVVATDVGGIRECIESGKEGWLVPPSEPQALADAILKVLEDQELGFKFSQNASRKAAEEFSIEKMTERHEAIYREVLESV